MTIKQLSKLCNRYITKATIMGADGILINPEFNKEFKDNTSGMISGIYLYFCCNHNRFDGIHIREDLKRGYRYSYIIYEDNMSFIESCLKCPKIPILNKNVVIL